MDEIEITFLANHKVPEPDGDGPEYKKGQKVKMNQASADHFIRRGLALESGKVPKDSKIDDRESDIIEAIGMLKEGKKEHWTQGGKPEVKALEEILGHDITAKERDEAFDKFQAQGE